MPEFCLPPPSKSVRAVPEVDKNGSKCLNFVYRRKSPKPSFMEHINRRHLPQNVVIYYQNRRCGYAQSAEDDDYYCREEEFRKLKKEVEHAKAEVEFLKKLLP